jgi:hypothetical protein
MHPNNVVSKINNNSIVSPLKVRRLPPEDGQNWSKHVVFFD